jgi:hypothetical protein
VWSKFWVIRGETFRSFQVISLLCFVVIGTATFVSIREGMGVEVICIVMDEVEASLAGYVAGRGREPTVTR